jgi:hypothetical protein
MFLAVFDTIFNITKKTVKFSHINNEYNGWNSIIVDLDSSQAKGLEEALNTLDGSKTWDEHLTYVLKSCLIHYERYDK